MATKSWLTVPESIRVVFDKFPLHVNPSAAVPKSVVSPWNEKLPATSESQTDRKIVLNVYNIDEQDNLPTDPESLEIQGLFKLKKLDKNLQLKVVSAHSAPQTTTSKKMTPKLPYLIDVGKNNKRTVYSSVSSVRSNLLAPVKGLPVMHTTLITSTLRDAWLVTVLLNDDLRQLVFGEGPYRIQKVPTVVEQFLQDGWTCAVVEELRPRYPAIIDSVVSTSKIGGGAYHFIKNQWSTRSSSPIIEFFQGTKKGQGVVEEILERAQQCLEVVNALLERNDYLGLGQDSGETNEDVTASGLGPLDVLLFSYVYSIQNRPAKDTKLGAMVNEYPLVVAHSQRVFQELFE